MNIIIIPRIKVTILKATIIPIPRKNKNKILFTNVIILYLI